MTDPLNADRKIILQLVDAYLEIAGDPRQEARKRLWAEHFAMRPVAATPFSVYAEGMSGSAWAEALGPAPLQTTTPVARAIEDQLRKAIWMDRRVDDDTPKWRSVIIDCPTAEDTGWGVPVRYERPAEADGARRPIPAFIDGLDPARLKPRQLTPDLEAGERRRQQARFLIDDRLAVHLRFPSLRPGTFDTLVDLRGMDHLFLDLFDRPEAVHEMSATIADSVLADMRRCEAHGWINFWPEDGGRYARGPHRIRAFYPSAGPPTVADEWPYFSDQTSAGLGPDQFEEFVVRYHVRMAAPLTRPTIYWHGCECLDRKWAAIQRIPNLKHVHVSPYSDLDLAVRTLRADLIIEAHSHPGDTFFALTDEEVEADVRERLERCRARPCGLFLSDIHSINGRPERLAHWAASCRRHAAK